MLRAAPIKLLSWAATTPSRDNREHRSLSCCAQTAVYGTPATGSASRKEVIA